MRFMVSEDLMTGHKQDCLFGDLEEEEGSTVVVVVA